MSTTIELSERYLTYRDEMCIAKDIEVKQLNHYDRFTVAATPLAHAIGYTAEAAWAQLLNIPYTFRPYDRNADDVGGYQIRSTQNRNGHLMIYDKDVRGVFVFGIVNDTLDVVEFAGWSTYERVVHPANYRTHLGQYQLKVPAYCMKQSELRNFSDMVKENVVL